MFHVKHIKKHLRVTTSVIFFILASFILGGCANVSLPKNESAPDGHSNPGNEIKELIPNTIRFSGQTMTIFVEDEEWLLYSDGESNPAGTAIRTRNDFLEREYDITLDVRSIKKTEIEETLRQSAESSTASAHAICYSAETASTLFANGYLEDIFALPDFNPRAAGFEDYSTDYRTSGNHLYLLSTPSLPYFNDIYCVYYRKDAITNAGLQLPEQLVLRGEWTVAAFRQYAEAMAPGVMSKSSYDSKLDTFGYAAREKGSLATLLAKSAGVQPIVKDSDGYPSLVSNPETLEETGSELQKLLNSKSRSPLYGSNAVDALLDGRLGMYIDKLSFVEVLYEKKEAEPETFDYGIVPLPSSDGKSCRSPVGAEIPVFAVPKTTPSRDLSGLGLSLLVGAGRTSVPQAAVDSYIALFSFNNDQSCMFDTIIKKAEPDFGTLYETALKPVSNCYSDLFYDRFEKKNTFAALIRDRKADFDSCISSYFRQTP